MRLRAAVEDDTKVGGFLKENWGNLTSLLGLGVSVWVLLVAQKAREAAEDARALARLKSLVEVLEEVSRNIQQVGIFLRDQKWDLVQLRVEEILASCKLASARWGDYLAEACRDDLLKVCSIARSIALAAARSSVRQLREAERLRALNAQVRTAELISTVLGEARNAEERRQRRP